MKTERVFLMELFLEEKLPKEIKLKIKDRFQEMEEPPQTPLTRQHAMHVANLGNNPELEIAVACQSPSMQRIMAANPDLVKPPTPTTPAAAQALASRQALIQRATSSQAEKPEDGRRSPRKI